MNRSHQLKYCKRCQNKLFDPNQGIICALTNKPAEFKNTCPDFLEANESLGSNTSNSSSDMNQNRYPALKSLCSIFNVFGWIVLLVAIGMVLFTVFTERMDIPAILLLVVYMMSGLFIAMITFAISEVIKLLVDIESNTRG